jgi:hypothetical protein
MAPSFEITASTQQSPLHQGANRALNLEFKIPYLNGSDTKLCRQQSYKIMKIQMFAGKGEDQQRKY